MRFIPYVQSLGFETVLESGSAASFAPDHLADRPAGAVRDIRRQSLAVVAAEIANYRDLVASDRLDMVLRIGRFRRHLLQPTVQAHDGRVVELVGDGALMVFPAASPAVCCALALRRRLEAAERGVAAGRRILLRIGVSLDEVFLIEDELFGLAVNLAARVMASGEPGEIRLTDRVAEGLDGVMRARCEAAGARIVRDGARPLQLHRIGGRELRA
jgi:adenylate cyclase